MEYYTALFMILLPISQTSTIEPRYQTAFDTVKEISWNQSEPKKYVDLGQGYVARIGDKYNKEHPIIGWVVGAGYTVAVKKQVDIRTSKLCPFSGCGVVLSHDFNTSSNSAGFSIPF